MQALPFEIIEGQEEDSGFVLLCEHANNCLPEPWEWSAEDQWLRETHWAYDIGAADFVRQMCQLSGAAAVLSGFSRLLIDPNRPLGSESLIRRRAEGRLIHMNEHVTNEELERRVQKSWAPYHAAASELLRRCPGSMVVGLHSFTPVYEGEHRDLEVGVLFDKEAALASDVAGRLERFGLKVSLNEPYSGFNGLMYSPQHHADAEGLKAIELEIRQDLIVQPKWVERFLPLFCQALTQGSMA